MQAGSGEMAHLLDDSRLREVAARSGAAADAACCAGRGMKTASDLSWLCLMPAVSNSYVIDRARSSAKLHRLFSSACHSSKHVGMLSNPRRAGSLLEGLEREGRRDERGGEVCAAQSARAPTVDPERRKLAETGALGRHKSTSFPSSPKPATPSHAPASALRLALPQRPRGWRCAAPCPPASWPLHLPTPSTHHGYAEMLPCE